MSVRITNQLLAPNISRALGDLKFPSFFAGKILLHGRCSVFVCGLWKVKYVVSIELNKIMEQRPSSEA
jgi:hypothetical protein